MSKNDQQENWEHDRLAWNLPRPRHEVTLGRSPSLARTSASSQADEKATSSQRPRRRAPRRFDPFARACIQAVLPARARGD